MSIVIVGGNECMVHRYQELCQTCNCEAKIFTKPKGIKEKMGTPDLLILFTNTVSHKMVKTALSNVSNKDVRVVRSHSSSMSSLKQILEQHVM